jgi:dTDP-4-dehydrorhamnose 3,5-epimerase
MQVIPTGFKDLFILEPNVFADARGYFMESYSRKTLLDARIDINFVQDNQSSSNRGVLRGLHFQNAPYAQTKLVRVLSGAILDIAVDIRKSESTFGKYFSITLSAGNKKQLLIPKGFAHGFIVLSEEAEVFYKADEYYYPQSEGGIIYNDPTIGIDWQVNPDEFVLSDKDKVHPEISAANFVF